MPVWYEYRNEKNKYVPEEVADPEKHELVEVYKKEFPKNATFTRVGFIRGNQQPYNADWTYSKGVH